MPLAAPVFGAREPLLEMESLYFNGGAHTEFYNNVQTDDSGGLRKFDFAPTLGLGAAFPMQADWRFFPEVNWVLPFRGETSQIIKNLVMIRADFGYNVTEWFRIRLGTSLMWLNQHGSGGKAKMKNGQDTSTFYYPEENQSSLNNTLDLGTEFMMDAWSVRLQTYTYSIFKSERRQHSYTVFLSYYWDQK